MFDQIAPHYDARNRLFSVDRDRAWRRRAARRAGLRPGQTALDLCTGTGRLAHELVPYVRPGGRVIGIDFSASMLELARAREPQVDFRLGDVSRLDEAEASVDAVTIGFGLRNLVDREGGLREMYRVLRPGGRLVILEFAPSSGSLMGGYRFYLGRLMPLVAGLFSRVDGQASPLGIYLDTTSDKILVAVLLVALAVVHLIPGWMAAVIIAREFLVTGLRSFAAALGVVIPAGGWGKAKTLITIVALLLVLLEGDARMGGWLSAQAAPGSWLLSPLGPFTISVWALLVGVIWTLGSGAEYIREAIPLLTRPATGVVSGAADEP